MNGNLDQNTGVSFYWVCETATKICFKKETVVYFALKNMKCSEIYEGGLD